MTLARSFGINLIGLNGERIDIEVDVSNGLPSYSLLGLPDATLSESRDRIRAAILNSNMNWPNRKVTVSLSPAWLPKGGSAFDLPIALTILAASGQIDPRKLESGFFLGELSLEGLLRPIRGVLPTLIAARQLGINQVIVPNENLREASLLRELDALSFPNLSSVIRYLENGIRPENPLLFDQSTSELRTKKKEVTLDMSEVSGQTSMKHALMIAAAGSHNLLMIGPPGAGKTMLAERLPTILPPLTEMEAIEVAGIHSIAGTLAGREMMSAEPPFVAPHHSTTVPALVGGGSSTIRPGACSLAHNGLLFIDEAPECDSGILDSLRQPLESGKITITRAALSTTYPARFMLVLAANPCPCGKYAGRGRSCECTSLQIRRYINRISGPLLDRLDMKLNVETPTRAELSEAGQESSAVMREKVISARAKAAERFKIENFQLNSQIPPKLLRDRYRPKREALALLYKLLDNESISPRGFHRSIRLAWSIADISGVEVPGVKEIEEALQLRSGLPGE